MQRNVWSMGASSILAAVEQYKSDVKTGVFPALEHSFK